MCARHIPKHSVLIIGGDMNAQIDKDENYKFWLHNSSNRNGDYLTDFSLENRLTCHKNEFPKMEQNYGPTPVPIMVKHRLFTHK